MHRKITADNAYCSYYSSFSFYIKIDYYWWKNRPEIAGDQIICKQRIKMAPHKKDFISIATLNHYLKS